MEVVEALENTDIKDRENAEEYVNRLYKLVQARNPNEAEFHQAVKEVLDSLVPVLVKNPVYESNPISRVNTIQNQKRSLLIQS